VASIQPLFDTVIYGAGTVGVETWVDLGVIASGKKLWLGYATYAGVDKNTQFETRSNNVGTSTGTVANTQLHDWAAAATGTSVDRDFYQNGNIMISTVQSTGVEHFWLRVLGQGNVQGGFDYIIRYTIY
jgi:bifunctional N-acetylglucosamine-1-phosphate-uridyltransferase/glucosamine-1-phosphate-acetyltransferase GlmU-like protein